VRSTIIQNFVAPATKYCLSIARARSTVFQTRLQDTARDPEFGVAKFGGQPEIRLASAARFPQHCPMVSGFVPF
jgi:hypothetical protein